MNVDEMGEIVEQLIDADARRFLVLTAQQTQVAAGNLDAIRDLLRDTTQAILHVLEFFALNLRRIADALINELEEARDDGERTVDIVNDARVNLATRTNHCLFQALVLQLLFQLAEFLRIGFNFK